MGFLLSTDKIIIVESARRYNVKRIMLFGSMLERQTANDIDLGVSGLKGRDFFKFHADLDGRLSRRLDLIDLDEHSPFVDFVEKTGEQLYDSHQR